MSTSPRTSSVPQDQTHGFVKWHRRILGFCLVIFASELGVFLLVFPWQSNWGQSWIPLHVSKLADLWMSRYFRGALSGLGLLNLYVSFSELIRQIRQSFRPPG